MPTIYIINPASSPPSYYSSEIYADADGGWVQVADLTIATVAALVPSTWNIMLTDEAIFPVDLDAEVDFVALTGKVTQRERMIQLSEEFRRRGRTVIIGGSFASLSPGEVRRHADILVTGELEEIAPQFFSDLEAGSWRDTYTGGQADIRLSPVPRWDLYPVDRAQSGALQTTRGCPFNCEFCDVIQYQGRKQRHKTTDQILRELDCLYSSGFRRVFIVDDNFTVHRQQARKVLAALAAWNKQRGGDPVTFMTQASLDCARDEDLLARCNEAGLRIFFMGVETMNEESLRETGKRQNLLQPIREALHRVVRAGIGIQAGIILGFDHDGPAIFEEMFEFLQDSPIPDAAVGVLTAPQATDLYRRLEKEGRLSGPAWDAAGLGPFSTNIAPKCMSRDELLQGTLALCEKLYSPEAYRQRMLNLITSYGGDSTPAQSSNAGSRERARLFLRTMRSIAALGSGEASMLSDVLAAANSKPAVIPIVMHFLMHYAQTRYFLAAGKMHQGQIAEISAAA